MKKITNNDISVIRNAKNDFTLSYSDGNGRRYERRYTDYGIRTAKKLFKVRLCEAMIKEAALSDMQKPLTREDVLIAALRCICGGSLDVARELLGNS